MKKIDLDFYDNVKPLNLHEYKAWRKLLPKVLKVGAELEFNLRTFSGDCRGFHYNCMCGHFRTYSRIRSLPYEQSLDQNSNSQAPLSHVAPCGTKCIYDRGSFCGLNIRSVFNCANASVNCSPTSCDTCDNFKFKCNPKYCIQYITECLLCENAREMCATCENRYDSRKTAANIRKATELELSATNNFGNVGESGVLQVVADGSLLNKGLEIPTVGRRLDFETFKNMFEHIIKVAKSHGGYTDSRCSFHIHILNEYYTKTNNQNGTDRHPDSGSFLNITSFEKNMPNIIFMNILQLWRKYETAIFWLSCGLPYIKNITRWEKFRASLLPCSPVLVSFQGIKDSIAQRVGRDRYGALNIVNSKTDGSRLHLEFRTCDMILSPSYMTSMCVLFYALIIKAVDISCYGLLNVENKEWNKKEILIKDSFVNGADREYGNNRLSDTSQVHLHRGYLVSKANELLDLLSPILAGFAPAEKILRKVAEKPVAFRLIEKRDTIDNLDLTKYSPQDQYIIRNFDTETKIMNVYDIEKELEINTKKIDLVSENLLKTIALGKIQGCNTSAVWVEEVSKEMKNSLATVSLTTIKEYINSLIADGDIYWNSNIGSYLYH